MSTLRGHFDGAAIVLDEPASLVVGQQVQVVVGAIANVAVESRFSPHPDPMITLMTGDAIDERDAIRIKPLDRVPPNFVRQPGSAAGQVKIAEDFDAIPPEFKDIV
jgi:hypothetical protein